MTKGLILGKFYPLHLGHLGLIQFAAKRCDKLIVLLCASDKETIEGAIRLQWLEEMCRDNPKIETVCFNYLESDLPNTSESSREVSRVWAIKITELLGELDLIFSSEAYGDYLAEFLNCKHICYEPERVSKPISATQIRMNPFENWDFIAPSAKPFFVKKIGIHGTESTGKSNLAQQLAAHYKTTYVPEKARDLLVHTDDCTEANLLEIAELQASSILEEVPKANKILFIDTNLNTTAAYSKFLFGKELEVKQWIIDANQVDLHLYLSADAPYVQDGTRLDKNRRNALDTYHKKELENKEISYQLISGTWEERFEKALTQIEKTFF